MACPARLTFPHLFHGRPVGSALSLEQVGVAFFAAKHAAMHEMREGDIPGVFILEEYIAGMAGDAVTFNAECRPPIVTGAARLASLHRFHADVVAIALFYEDFRVTHITAGPVYPVAEDNFADGLGLDFDFIDHYPHAPHAPRLPHTNGLQRGRHGDQQQDDH
jgi:hypothetical protein